MDEDGQADEVRHMDKETRKLKLKMALSEQARERLEHHLDKLNSLFKANIRELNAAKELAEVATKLKEDFLRDKNNFLETEVAKRTAEVMAIQDVTIHAMASLAETRDSDTGNHIRRTQQYVRLLAEKLRSNTRFSHFLDDNKTLEMLLKSAPLHDIGKVGIPDRILLKPGRLEQGEFETMKTHCALGRDAIIKAERGLGIEIPFLKIAKEIAYSHHEKWDGSGYPECLSGDDIPISARLMTLADVYDALISRRVYKVSMPHGKAVLIISESAGTHFDPDIVDFFMELKDEFKAISDRYADSDSDIEKKAEYHGKNMAGDLQ